MERNTLSSYGWIIVTLLVLVVIISFATPFGEYVGTGLQNTMIGVYQTVKDKDWAKGDIEFGEWKEKDILATIPAEFEETGQVFIEPVFSTNEDEDALIKGLNGVANVNGYNFAVLKDGKYKYRLTTTSIGHLRDVLCNVELTTDEVGQIANKIESICIGLSAKNVSSIEDITDATEKENFKNTLSEIFAIAGCTSFEYKNSWIRFTMEDGSVGCFPIKLQEVYN